MFSIFYFFENFENFETFEFTGVNSDLSKFHDFAKFATFIFGVESSLALWGWKAGARVWELLKYLKTIVKICNLHFRRRVLHFGSGRLGLVSGNFQNLKILKNLQNLQPSLSASTLWLWGWGLGLGSGNFQYLKKFYKICNLHCRRRLWLLRNFAKVWRFFSTSCALHHRLDLVLGRPQWSLVLSGASIHPRTVPSKFGLWSPQS